MNFQQQIEEELLAIKNGAPSLHAKYSISGLKRTIECPTSIFLSKGLTSKQSSWAMEGKYAHHLAEKFLEAKLTGVSLPPLQVSNLITFDMIRFGKEYADYIFKTISPYLHLPYTWFIESRVHVDKKNDCWGTTDFIFLYKPTSTTLRAIIIDYKYGEGVEVTVEDEDKKLNWQLVGYSLGAIKDYSTKTVRMEGVSVHIFQPRIDNAPKPVDLEADILLKTYLPIIRERILLVEKWFREGEIEQEDFNNYQKVGPWCQFCLAKTICKPYVENKMGNSIELFKKVMMEKSKVVINGKDETKSLTPAKITKEDVNKMLNKGTISPEDFSFIALNASSIIAFIEQFKPIAVQLMQQGKKLPNIKLIETKGSRTLIKDTKRLIKSLKALGIENPMRTIEKFMTITEIEDRIGKGKIDHLTETGEGGFKIAPISSEAPEYKLGVKNTALFKDALLKRKEVKMIEK